DAPTHRWFGPVRFQRTSTSQIHLLARRPGRIRKESFLAQLQEKAEGEEFVRDVQLVEMSQDQGVAVLNVETGVLQINTLHPFVAHFLDEYEDKKRSLPLELLAMSDVLL